MILFVGLPAACFSNFVPSGEDRLLDGNLDCDSLLIDLPANEPT